MRVTRPSATSASTSSRRWPGCGAITSATDDAHGNDRVRRAGDLAPADRCPRTRLAHADVGRSHGGVVADAGVGAHRPQRALVAVRRPGGTAPRRGPSAPGSTPSRRRRGRARRPRLDLSWRQTAGRAGAASTRAMFVSTTATSASKAKRHHRPSRVRPDPGEGEQAVERCREGAGLGHPLGRGMQVARPARVAEALPAAQDVAEQRGRAGRRRRERRRGTSNHAAPPAAPASAAASPR